MTKKLPIHNYMTPEGIGKRNKKAEEIRDERKAGKELTEAMTVPGIDPKGRKYRKFKKNYSYADLPHHRELGGKLGETKPSENQGAIEAMQADKKIAGNLETTIEQEELASKEARLAELKAKLGGELPQKEGKEVIIGNKKYSLLQAKHNGNDIIDGGCVDQYGNKGIPGVTYLMGEAAKRVATAQNKNLFKTEKEEDEFIGSLPGETLKEKILYFVDKLGLEKAGFWSPTNERWRNVGSVGYVSLSEVNSNGSIRGLIWGGSNTDLKWFNSSYHQPVVVFEDC